MKKYFREKSATAHMGVPFYLSCQNPRLTEILRGFETIGQMSIDAQRSWQGEKSRAMGKIAKENGVK